MVDFPKEYLMKVLKTIISLSLALFLITALISCGGAEGPEAKNEEIDVIVPWNMTNNDKSAKGLTNMMPDGTKSVFYTDGQRPDGEYAEAVMTCQPLFPTLKTISGVKLTATTSQLDLGFTMYGYTIVPDNLKSRINRDGIYVLYKIYEGENHVGYFEYYYNALKSRVTYREYVMLTIDAFTHPTDPAIYFMNNAVMVFCFEDVPVKLESDGSVTLSANQWNGTALETSQCFADFFFVGDHIVPTMMGDISPRFERRVFTIKSSKGITSEFGQTWASVRSNNQGTQYNWTSAETIIPNNDPFRTIMRKTFENGSGTPYAGDYIIDKTTKDLFTADTAIEFVKVLYKNGSSAVVGNWNDYDSFKNKSLNKTNLCSDLYGDDSTNIAEWLEKDTTMTLIQWMSYFNLNKARSTDVAVKKANRAFWNMPYSNLTAAIYNNASDSFGFKTLFNTAEANNDADAKNKVLTNFIPLCLTGDYAANVIEKYYTSN